MPGGTAWRRCEVLDPGPAPAGPTSRFCYLDTETTGLSGGTGTQVFAAAVARRTQAGLELVQLFLAEPGQEVPFLEALGAELALAPEIGTYNGASFDLPILRTRWALTRLPGELPAGRHLDLLHLVRSLLGGRLRSRTLHEVETRVLGFEREGDLPGALVPEAYFQYLRRGWSPLLEGALAHNRQDAATLLHLHLRLQERLDLREAGLESDELLALGRHLLRRGRRADGWRTLRRATAQGDGPAAGLAAVLLARSLARRGAAPAAERLLAELPPGAGGTLVAVTRARLLEWRLRDVPAALAVVEAALPEAFGDPLREDLEHRRRRLLRKVERSAARSRHRGVGCDGADRDQDLQRLEQLRIEAAAVVA